MQAGNAWVWSGAQGCARGGLLEAETLAEPHTEKVLKHSLAFVPEDRTFGATPQIMYVLHCEGLLGRGGCHCSPRPTTSGPRPPLHLKMQ